jgi:tetratricopeptide (TPR) repeat protein
MNRKKSIDFSYAHLIEEQMMPLNKSIVLMIGYLQNINLQDVFLKENFFVLYQPNLLENFINHGVLSNTTVNSFKVHPLFAFHLRKRANEMTESAIQDFFYELLTNKAIFINPQLKKQSAEERLLIMEEIERDFLNFKWVCQQTATKSDDFVELFKTVTDFLINQSQNEEVTYFCNKILACFKKTNLKGISSKHQISYLKVHEIKAYSLHAMGKYQEALNSYYHALTLFDEWQLTEYNAMTQAQMYQNVGVIYRRLNKFEQSLTYLKKARKIFEANQDEIAIASVMQHEGNLQLSLNQYEQAIDIFQSILPVFEKAKETYTQCTIYQNLGTAFRRLKKFETAESFYFKALTIYQSFKDEKGEAQIYQNLGVSKWDSKEFELSTQFYKRALNIYIPLNALIQQGRIYQNLGVNHKNIGEFVDALSYYCIFRCYWFFVTFGELNF